MTLAMYRYAQHHIEQRAQFYDYLGFGVVYFPLFLYTFQYVHNP
jgi:hypothetical protein